MTDAFLGLIAHPPAVIARIRGQALCPLPRDRGLLLPRFLLPLGVDGRAAGELRRDLDQRLVDQHRDRVEVGGVGFQAETLGLQRDRAAPAKGS